MSAQAANATATRKKSPVYVVVNGEITLNTSLKNAWRHIINYASWQNYSSIQHISGDPGAEGEVILQTKEEAGFKFPSYYTRTIKLEPERRVIWKTYSEPGAELELFGIVEFRANEVAPDQTQFWCQVLYEFMVAHQDDRELDRFRAQQYENFQGLLDSVFPKLKALAEHS